MPYQVPLSNGQVLPVPTKWADVTLGQYVSLVAPEPGEPRTVAELLLGLEADGLDALAADDVPYIANLIAFAGDSSPLLELLPPPGLPDVGTLPWGCLVLVQQHFAAHPDRPDLFHLPYVLSVYRTQLAWGKVVEAKRAACEAALLASPVTECYAEGSFFLTACRKWSADTPPTKPTKMSPAMRNSKPTPTRRWLRDLGLRFRSTP